MHERNGPCSSHPSSLLAKTVRVHGSQDGTKPLPVAKAGAVLDHLPRHEPQPQALCQALQARPGRRGLALPKAFSASENLGPTEKPKTGRRGGRKGSPSAIGVAGIEKKHLLEVFTKCQLPGWKELWWEMERSSSESNAKPIGIKMIDPTRIM